MSDERAEMQRAAINGVLDRVEMCLTSHEEARGTDCTATEADRVLEAADVIRRIRGECLSPAESVPCGPVVDMEKAREGLDRLRELLGITDGELKAVPLVDALRIVSRCLIHQTQPLREMSKCLDEMLRRLGH